MASLSSPEPFAKSDGGFDSVIHHHDSPEKTLASPHCVFAPPLPDGSGDGNDSFFDRFDDEGNGDNENFEFALVIDDPRTVPAITDNEIVSHGQIPPIYPVFGRPLLLEATPGVEEQEKAAPVRGTLRRLFIEERESSILVSSSSSLVTDELAGIPPGTYCIWSPSSSRCKKNNSTSSSLRWRIRNLVVGRGHNDGKEKLVFLAAEKDSPIRADQGKATSKEEEKTGAKGKWSREIETGEDADASTSSYTMEARPDSVESVV